MTSYFTQTSDADAIAITLVPALIPAYLALTSSSGDVAIKTSALLIASGDVDLAVKYQGRRYDTVNQTNEFPRVAHDPSTVTIPNVGGVPVGTTWGEIVWDLDPTSNEPIVPANVLQAVIYQADFVLRGGDPRIDDQYAGVKDEKVGSLAASYSLGNKAAATGLCRRAYLLMRYYQLATGSLL